MTAILGISAFYHDSAAAIIVDGEIIAAAQEERFTRIKHDAAFPEQAIAYCLEEAGLTPDQVDLVGFYEKPFLKFERLLETTLAFAPWGFKAFLDTIPSWLKTKLHLPRVINDGLNQQYNKRIVFVEHHESHAASAFYPSPFEEAAFLTVDGVGEWATASYGVGRGNRIEIQSELYFPHSVGLLYSAFTYYCGFKVNSGEYKLMGLAPYGEPRYADLIREKLVDIKADGSIRLDLSYFNYCHGLTMTSQKFHQLFGGEPRQPESQITQRDMDLAASIQMVTEEILMKMVQHVHAQTGQSRLCMKAPLKKSGFSRQQETQAAHWGWPCLSGINCSGNRARFDPKISSREVSWGLVFLRIRFGNFWMRVAWCTIIARMKKNFVTKWPVTLRMRKWWAGCRGEWNLGHVHWEGGVFSAMRAVQRCSRS